MTIFALYVYAPTVFDIKNEIESESGPVEPEAGVTLEPGLYRLLGQHDAAPAGGKTGGKTTNGALSHQIVMINTKGNWPDPPSAAKNQFGEARIKSFFSGEGIVGEG